MDIIAVEKLNSGYGKSQVLFDVSLRVIKSSICAILGPNGSGKSTLLKSIFGLTSVYDGSIKYNGIEISNMKPHEIAKLGISYLPQVENLYANLSVRENLIMAGYILSKEKRVSRIKEVLEIFPTLNEFLEREAYTLSGGERQMLVMAKGLMRQPALMMFDEPSANLAPKIVDEIFEKIKALKELGITIILVEQNTKKALEIAENTCLLVSGGINYYGNSKDLAANEEFGKLFLGL
ncbi:MAG: ABC transporter ATP-binding protein [Candidatus Hodarchaeota archaeon]